MSKTVLCTDIGTTSLKTAIISKDGVQIAFSQKYFTNPDSRYISADWLKTFIDCVTELQPLLKQVEAISISGNGPTVVSEDGSTVLWNSKHIPILPVKTLGEAHSLFMPKIITLKDLYSQEFNKSRFIFSGPEYLIWKLTGNRITILPEKRYESAYWNDELLILNQMNPEKFPSFKKIGECYGVLNSTEPLLKDLAGIPVYGCGPDFIAAMIGTGCTQTGALCDCAGSSEGFNLCIPIPYKDSRIRLLPSVTPGLWNAAVMIPESGRLLFNYKNKMEKETGKAHTYPELIDHCFDNPDSEGHFILETLLKNSEYAISVLKEVAAACNIEFPHHMFVAGGQAKNKRWMTEKENRLNIKLEVSKIPDAELLGDWKAADYENL